MLKVVNLCAGYEEIQILKNVNLHINKNEIVALIGPNGAGKSTVLRSIFGLAKIKKGDILFQEMSILNKKPHELIKERICYVNQGKIVFDHLTVLENLQIGTKQENINNNKTLERVYHQFPVLFKKQENLAKGLSGGERQQLALGRALMQEPILLLLDEPSLGLSPKLQKELFKSIVKLKGTVSILIVEQNAKKAIEIADRTYVLENGVIVLEGDKNIIFHKKIKDIYLGGY